MAELKLAATLVFVMAAYLIALLLAVVAERWTGKKDD